TQLLELIGEAVVGTVKVLALGDELHGVVALNASPAKDCFEQREIARVDHEQFVLVKLHFHRPIRCDDRKTGAAVVEQQILKVIQVAYKYGALDLLAHQVVMLAINGLVAGLEHEIIHLAKRFEQFEEDVKQILRRNRGGQERHLKFVLGIAENVP